MSTSPTPYIIFNKIYLYSNMGVGDILIYIYF